MNVKRNWTADEIETLRRITREGVNSTDAAARFGTSAGYIRKMRVELGIVPKGWRGGPIFESKPAQEAEPKLCRVRNWWPLEPGHEITWSAISDQPWPGPTA
jgi:hypothetical protein